MENSIIGKKFKATVQVNYFVEGHGSNIGLIEGEVIREVGQRLVISSFGNEMIITKQTFLNFNKFKN